MSRESGTVMWKNHLVWETEPLSIIICNSKNVHFVVLNYRKGTDDLPLQDQKMDEKEGNRLKWKDNLIVQNT